MPYDKTMWRDSAECAGMDTEIFFPEDNIGKRKELRKQEAVKEKLALETCARCPVRGQCLEFAVEHECSGIWGGVRRR